jgi:nitrilase
MDQPFRVAAIQMISTPEVAANLARAGELVERAAAQGAQLALLPEYFGIMGRETDKVALRERDGEGPMQDFLRDTAARLRMWIIGGTVPLECADANRVRNSTLAFGPAGERIARYDKIHLFGFSQGEEQYHEARTIEPGGETVTFDAPPGLVGLSVCYDLRFPELYRRYAGASLIVVPAAFTAVTGEAHWEVLLRARAIENQCYVLAAAQGGTHPNGRRTHGHSMLIDPWGVVVAQLEKGEGIVVGDIDPVRLREVRRDLPALEHRTLA